MNIAPTSIKIPRIGIVLYEYSNKAKSLNISIKPPKNIRVAIPIGHSLQNAIDFTKKKESWIKRTLSKIENLSIVNCKSKNILNNKNIDFLLNRLDLLAVRYSFNYNKGTIKNQKTRWGSCSEKNNINLNIQLINLPLELIDYVILHELVHTIVKNHSIIFWKTLEKFVNNPKLTDKKLKNYYIV